MRILFITRTGKTRAITLFERRWTIAASAAAAACLAGWIGWQNFSGSAVPPQTELASQALEQWRARMSEDASALTELEARVSADAEAEGRMLAQMQARLFRMEALGVRLVESASLDPEEFDFDSSPALGGPVVETEGLLPTQLNLVEHMASLARRLRWREAEFTILENVLASRDMLAEQHPTGIPVRRGWISSPYGSRVDPIHGRQAFHAGVDFVGKAGSEVLAAGSGVVTFAGDKHEYGKTVEINHGNGLLTRYGHHSALQVEVGDIVRRGDVIGLMGSTGRATGHHVHFEVEKDGKHINPAGFLKPSARS